MALSLPPQVALDVPGIDTSHAIAHQEVRLGRLLDAWAHAGRRGMG